MAHPKRRQSRSRSRKRRTHDKIDGPALTISKESGKAVRRHTIDPHSGYYRGRRVLTVTVKDKKKKDEE